MKRSIQWMVVLTLAGAGLPAGFAAERRGGLALQFDDGWTAWLTETAPLIQEYGGTATGFVNDKYVLNGRITLDELRRLQDDYGWEIGTHTASHQNAPRYVQSHGVDAWLANELEPSLARLREAGLRVEALAFPFNASTPEIAQAALARVGSYRRVDSLAVADRVRADGSLPGTPIDTAQYAPLDLVKKWIDLAHRRDTVLFLYGHRILPDDAFTAGRVVAIADDVVTLDRPVELAAGEDYVLVPDALRRQNAQNVIPVLGAAGAAVTVAELPPGAVAVGNEVLVGPSYGTRRSDFEEILRYAAERLQFYTIADVRAGRHRAGAAAAEAAP
ncbi:MAG: polysaccharide deacetylase family protein [Kiritimatiellia bacterium]